MKKIIALALVLAAVFALCACGPEKVIEKEVEKEVEKVVELPVMPDNYKKYQGLIDALEAGDYDSASEIFSGLLPQPEVPPIQEVTITKDNFFDYFEYREFPPTQLNFKRTSTGEIYGLIAGSGFYLKDGYRIVREKSGECKVEAGVKYQVSWFAYGNKGINIDPANCSYEVTLKANDKTDEDELIEGNFFYYPDGTEDYLLFFGTCTQLSNERGSSTLLIDADSIELVSASGTLYLYQ